MDCRNRIFRLIALCLIGGLLAGYEGYAQSLPILSGVEPQPFISQVTRLGEALSYLGSSFPERIDGRIEALGKHVPSPQLVRELQEVLDPLCLLMVHINPQARVKVMRGPAQPSLIQNGWRTFLIKVYNEAGVTSRLEVESPNIGPMFHRSTGAQGVHQEDVISRVDLADRFLETKFYRRRPLLERLSGLKLEYALLQVYTRAVGKREARIGFHVGQGTRDLALRNAVAVLFDCERAVRVVFRVKDYDGQPTMGFFVITDGMERLIEDPSSEAVPKEYRLALARRPDWKERRTFRETEEGFFPFLRWLNHLPA